MADRLAPLIAEREESRKVTENKCFKAVLDRLASHDGQEDLQFDLLTQEFEGKIPTAFPRVIERMLEQGLVEFGEDQKGQKSHKFIRASARGLKKHAKGGFDVRPSKKGKGKASAAQANTTAE